MKPWFVACTPEEITEQGLPLDRCDLCVIESQVKLSEPLRGLLEKYSGRLVENVVIEAAVTRWLKGMTWTVHFVRSGPGGVVSAARVGRPLPTCSLIDGNKLIMPPLNKDVLPGITQQLIFERKLNIRWTERSVFPADVGKKCKAAFLCSNAVGAQSLGGSTGFVLSANPPDISNDRRGVY